MNRRGFLTLLGAGVALVAAEPVRRYWQVPRGAPVGAARLVPLRALILDLDHGYTYETAAYGEGGDLFGIDAANYPQWKAQLYDGSTLREDLERMIERERTRVYTPGPILLPPSLVEMMREALT